MGLYYIILAYICISESVKVDCNDWVTPSVEHQFRSRTSSFNWINKKNVNMNDNWLRTDGRVQKINYCSTYKRNIYIFIGNHSKSRDIRWRIQVVDVKCAISIFFSLDVQHVQIRPSFRGERARRNCVKIKWKVGTNWSSYENWKTMWIILST